MSQNKSQPCPTSVPNGADAAPATVPLSVKNPAGLTSLSTRVGDFRSFFESLRRRLSSRQYPELGQLQTRSLSDPTMALLDAWSVVGDVLTYYNERYTQESYLRTAREARSLQELSKLIGYKPGPGVASSTYLAFTLEKGPGQESQETLIPKGTQVQSVPGAGESAQTFETMEDLVARPEWSAIRPRQTVPHMIRNVQSVTEIFLQGTTHNIQPGCRILLAPTRRESPAPLIISNVELNHSEDWTRIEFAESEYSIRKMRDEVTAALNRFHSYATDATNFSWIVDLAEKAKAIRDGDAGTQKLSDWNTLSTFDKTLSKFMRDTVPNDSASAIAGEELDDESSPLNSITVKLSEALNNGCRKLHENSISLVDSLVKLDETALKVYGIAMALTDPNDQQQVNDAVTGIGNSGWSNLGPLPIELRTHENVIKAIVTAIEQFQSIHSSNSPHGLPVTQAEIDAFNDTLIPEFRRFWGIKTDGSSFQSNANEINIHFKNALQTLKTLKAEVNFRLYKSVLSVCIGLAELIGVTSHSTHGPSTERISEVKKILQINLATYADTLNAVNYVEPASASKSRLVETLSTFIKESIEGIEKATGVATKHDVAVNALREIGESGVATRSLVSMMTRWIKLLDYRRELFQKDAIKMRRALATLSSAGGELQPLWQRVEDAILRCITPIDSPEQIDRSNPKSIKRLPDLNATMAEFGNRAQPLLSDILAFLPRDPVMEERAELLKREVIAFVERDGGSENTEEPKNPLSTSGGGIGSIITSEGANGRIAIRSSRVVLEIPGDTAADVVAQLASSFQLANEDELRSKWQALRFEKDEPVVTLLSAASPLFGYNAPKETVFPTVAGGLITQQEWKVKKELDYEGNLVLSGDPQHLLPPFDVLLHTAGHGESARHVSQVNVVTRSDYGLSNKVTTLRLKDEPQSWPPEDEVDIRFLRNTVAFVPVKTLSLAEIPIDAPIGPDSNSFAIDSKPETEEIELDGLYIGLISGQRVVIHGERLGLPGVLASEPARILYVLHRLRPIHGDRVHTRIVLDRPLGFTYRRDTVIIYANVVPSSHGETTSQILGSGDASKLFQSMPLAKGPLTYLPAPNETGVQSTLEVRVNNIQWHEQNSLLESAANGRDYVVQANPEGLESIQFGDGVTGARLPTGNSNVVATYRTGLGRSGNVRAKTLTNLPSRPMGVKDVTNPLPATGGADPETIEQIRTNAPIAVMALDRLVSVRDYADFARNFAGIDKAVAQAIRLGGQPSVGITIAGAGDVPIAPDSELQRNLIEAYRRMGDPLQRVQIKQRELLLLFLSANIHIKPDYRFSFVEPMVRQSLYDRFSFARRELGQSLYLSEVYSAIQNIEGVAYVDIDIFATLSQSKFDLALKSTSTEPANASNEKNGTDNANSGSTNLPSLFAAIREPKPQPDKHLEAHSGMIENSEFAPAQLIYLSPDVPDSLFLTEVQ